MTNPGPAQGLCPRTGPAGSPIRRGSSSGSAEKDGGSGERGVQAHILGEEALDQIAGELQRVKGQYGPQSVFLLGRAGSMSALHNSGRTGYRFFSLFGGCTTCWGNTSMEGALFSSRMTFGTPCRRQPTC